MKTSGRPTSGEGPPGETGAGGPRRPNEPPRGADVGPGLLDVDSPTDAHTERPAPADQADITRLTERADVIIGIVAGVFGALFAVGLIFLPASTLLEKTCVLFTCIALSIAAVTGIGAWRSARRFAVTATSACVAVVCLAALSMAAQREQPSPSPPPPTPLPTRTSTSPSATPSVSPTALPAGSLVFDDDFESNKGWDTGSPDGGAMAVYEPGALQVRVKVPDRAYSSRVPVQDAPGFTSLRIDARMARTGGDGSFGLLCRTSGGGTYDFWTEPDGSNSIQAFAAMKGSDSTGRKLASGTVSRWDPTQPHVLTAACVEVQGGTKLTFQIDGRVVATAFDTIHTESFAPFLIFQSAQHAALDLNILHVTVAKL